MRDVDQKDMEILRWIARWKEDNGYDPQLADICEAFRYAKPIHCAKRLDLLAAHGFLKLTRFRLHRDQRRYAFEILKAGSVTVRKTADDLIRIQGLPRFLSLTQAIDLAEALKKAVYPRKGVL